MYPLMRNIRFSLWIFWCWFIDFRLESELNSFYIYVHNIIHVVGVYFIATFEFVEKLRIRKWQAPNCSHWGVNGRHASNGNKSLPYTAHNTAGKRFVTSAGDKNLFNFEHFSINNGGITSRIKIVLYNLPIYNNISTCYSSKSLHEKTRRVIILLSIL